MITYIEAQQRTDAFLEEKVQEISKLNHSIMGKFHSKEFRWNAKRASLLHFEHIAFVILRDYLVEAVRKGVEDTWRDVGNCISDNVLFFILNQANIKMKTKLWDKHLHKAKGTDEELYSSYSSANWFIVGMRFWLDAHPDEKTTFGTMNNRDKATFQQHIIKKIKRLWNDAHPDNRKALRTKIDWGNTTLLRKYIITNLHNPNHPFNDFFNDTNYRTLVDTFCIPYLSPEAEEELNSKPELDDPKKDALIDALEQLREKLDSGKSSLQKVLEELGELSKKVKDIFKQGGTIATASIEISTKLQSISNQNTEIANDVQDALDNISKIWEDKFANEEDRLAHYKAIEEDKRLLGKFLAKYKAEHKGWLQKHAKGQQTFYTIKKDDHLVNQIIFAILDERPDIKFEAIDAYLRYEDGYKTIPSNTIYDARKRWNYNRNGN